MDKFSGSLAGVRAAELGVDGDDAEAATASTGVEELLHLSDGSLLRAALAADGTVVWGSVPPAETDAELRRVVAQSQMASMLKDAARNEAYRAAITDAVAGFREATGRAPAVLDVGAGTGLLSMLAARAGAASVTGVEQWRVMAALAEAVVAANGLSGTVRIVPKRSLDVTVGGGPGSDMPAGRADLVVSEILDSALLGEGIVASLRHAYAHLADVRGAAAAACVPLRARLVAQLVSSPDLLGAWNDTSRTELRPGVPLARRDLRAAPCAASPIAIPVHLSRLQPPPAPLCAPFVACEVDFTPAGLAPDAPAFARPHVHTLPPLSQPQPGGGASAATAAHAVVFWWDCDLWARPANGSSGAATTTASSTTATTTYGTSPAAVEAQGWQDHWVQCVVPLPAPVLPAADGSWTVAAALRDLAVDFRVGPGGAAVWPSKRAHSRAVKEGAAAPASATAPALYVEPELCVCGLHRLATHERRWLLADGSSSGGSAGGWVAAFREGVDALLTSGLRQQPAGTATPPDADAAAPYRVLCLGEGSLCAVAAASSLAAATAAHAAGRRLHVVAVEPSQPAGVQADALLQAAVAAAGTGAAVVEPTVACVGPTEPLLSALPEWLAPAASDDDDSDGAGAPPAALPPFHAVAAEPYVSTMVNAPLWTAAHLWHRFRALAADPAFAAAFSAAAVLPLRAVVRAQGVAFARLAATHGPVGRVCGFDHAPFDAVEAGYSRHLFAYPAWQYEHTLVGGGGAGPVDVLALDYARAGEGSEAPCGTATVPTGGGDGAPAANALLLWVDYELAPGVWASTGPAPGGRPGPWRQQVRFLASPSTATAVRVTVRLDAHASGALVVDVEEG